MPFIDESRCILIDAGTRQDIGGVSSVSPFGLFLLLSSFPPSDSPSPFCSCSLLLLLLVQVEVVQVTLVLPLLLCWHQLGRA